MSSFGPAHFINRELSWLEFNQRVLDEALDAGNPLLERLKFLSITCSNLDEFFEVRVAAIKQQMESESAERSRDGMNAAETFDAIVRRARRMVSDVYACWREVLSPALAAHGIHILEMNDLTSRDQAWLGRYFEAHVRPVLTPLAIDPAHPFPQLLNKSLNLIVRLEMTSRGERHKHLAVVQIPRILPRLIQLPRGTGQRDFVWLSRLIGARLADLFPGTTILGYWPFRVTRNSELYIDEEEMSNLLKAVELELHNRRKGDAVRLEIDQRCPEQIRVALLKTLNLTSDDLYLIDGPLNLTLLMTLYEEVHSPELRDAPFVPALARGAEPGSDLFAAIRQRDILLHHPYESFNTVVEFLEQAAEDPQVLAIKQTLYRSGGDPRVLGALTRAAENGKQVAAVVELRARFDEAHNIERARQLEEAGVHVVYGLVGYKIHAKLVLVVRSEGNQIRRYVHLGTGNYNPATARLYTDVGMLTCRPDIGEDATDLFNLLTGVCQFQGMRKLLVAPFDLHRRLLELIDRERQNAARGLPARIVARMNSLVEPELIEALYRASQAGVQIDLLVRGVCCLRPGIRGVSDHITVRSVVDRFLEHSRIYCFENGCRPEVFVSSADWMPRNPFRRIEVAFPVEDGTVRDRIINEIMAVSLADNTKARTLQADGSYLRAEPKDGTVRRSQTEFMARAAAKRSLEIKPAQSGKPQKMKLAPRPGTIGKNGASGNRKGVRKEKKTPSHRRR